MKHKLIAIILLISTFGFSQRSGTGGVGVNYGVANKDFVFYSTVNTVPVAAPINGVDTHVLANGDRYEWTGSAWVLMPKANVRFGTTAPVIAGDKEGDHYFRTKTGTNAGDPYQEYIFDNGTWYRTDEEDGLFVTATDGAPAGIIPVDATSYRDEDGVWAPNVTLPTAVGRKNEIFTFKHDANLNTTILQTNRSPVGALVMTNTRRTVQFVSDGYNWVQMAASTPIPENIIDFSVNANPNTAGTTFAPATPNDPDAIYFSTIDNSTWKWNGTTYVTYTAPPSTEWNLSGTTTDAGGNKTAAIGRTGSVGVGTITPVEKLHVVGNIMYPGFGNQLMSSSGFSSFGELNSSVDAYMATGLRATLPNGFLKSVSNPASFISAQISDGITFHTGITGGVGTAVTRVANERVRVTNDGLVGINTNNPLTTLHINGSFSTKLDFFPSTGGTTIVTPTMACLEIGGGNLAHTVTLPSATLFNGRRIVVKLAGNTTGTIVTVNSAGGTVENDHGLLGATAILQSGFKGGEWQSDGSNWQLISSNTGGVHRISAAGLLAGNIIPNGYNVYQDFNGVWQSNVTLPVSGSKTGQLLTFEHFAGFNTTIEVANSSMTVPLVVTASMGGAAWIWNGIKWNLITN